MEKDYSNAPSHRKNVDDGYILLMKWFVSWTLAKFSCAQMIFKEGHYHVSGNQQNFVLLPTFTFLLFSSTLTSHPSLPGKFIASRGHSPVIITKKIMLLFTPILYYMTSINLGNKICHLCNTLIKFLQKWSISLSRH